MTANLSPSRHNHPDEEDDHHELYLSLSWRPATTEAQALCHHVHDLILEHRRQSGAPGGQRPRIAATTSVVGGFLGDLVNASRFNPPRPLFRSWKAEAFTPGNPGCIASGGRHAALAARNALLNLGLIEVAEPFQPEGWVKDHTGKWRRTRALAATYRSTPAFVALATHHGVDSPRHFAPVMPAYPVELSVEPPPRRAEDKADPEPLQIPLAILQSPAVQRDLDQMRDLNAFLDSQALCRPDGSRAFHGLRRLYKVQRDHRDDLTAYGWSRYGRLHDKGRAGYQQQSKIDRLALTINGEPVAEVDIRASHLTAIYGWRGHKNRDLLEHHDPYGQIFDRRTRKELPRDIVKAAVTPILAKTRSHLSEWPEKTVKNLLKKNKGLKLDDFPAPMVSDAILQAHPVIADWKATAFGPHDLMFRESRVVLATMLQAKVLGIAAYPIHDSLLVLDRHAELVSQMLVDAFAREFDCRPSVKTTRASD